MARAANGQWHSALGPPVATAWVLVRCGADLPGRGRRARAATTTPMRCSVGGRQSHRASAAGAGYRGFTSTKWARSGCRRSQALPPGSNALRGGAVALSLLLATCGSDRARAVDWRCRRLARVPDPGRDRRGAVRDLGSDRHLVRGLPRLQLPVHGATVHAPGLRSRRVAEPAAVPDRGRGHRPAHGACSGTGPRRPTGARARASPSWP